MSSIVNIKALGLNFSPNNLDVPPGSMSEASNIIIKRNSVVESRRGFKLFGSSFSSVGDRAKQLLFYKTRLFRHYFDSGLQANKLQYDSDGNGTFVSLNGTYNETQVGLRIKSIESNGNFYFTTDQGIQKISAKTPNDLSANVGLVTPAGGIKAIDLSSRIKLTPGNISGFLPQDSTVAYRLVWGSKDLNNNLILGTPSQRSELYNPLINMLLFDYTNVLSALDGISSNSLINNGNYVNIYKLSQGTSASTLFTSLQNLTTTIDSNIIYATQAVSAAPLTISSSTIVGGVATITFVQATVQNYFSTGSRIFLSGFATGSGSINGSQQVTLTTSTTIQFNTTAVGPVTVTGAAINSYEYRARAPSTVAFPLEVGSPYQLPALPPTDNDLVNLQGTIKSIIIRLQAEPTAVIGSAVASQFIAPLAITTTATALVSFTIPQDVTLNNFYQLYRSNILQATGVSVLSNFIPNDEMKLVYEAYVTPTDLANKTITIEDITPDIFAGAYLYSNQVSGEGALQTNDLPPFALDINKFKNTLFFANTKTRQRKLFSLLGVVNMAAAYNSANPPKLTITDGIKTSTYSFILGVKQVSNIVCNAASTLAASGNSSYFTLNTANNVTSYYFWYQIGTSVDPLIAGKTGIKISGLVTTDTATTVANKTRDAIASLLFDFSASSSTNTVTVNNLNSGYTASPTAGTSGFATIVTTSGAGERASTKEVLLSSLISPSQAVDETARSLIRVVNQDSNDTLYLYYVSSSGGVPGKFFAESRNLNSGPFYLVTSDSITGQSFNPDLSPDLTISSISIAPAAVITTTTPHLLQNGASVVISNSNSTPSVDGLYPITYISATQFSIPVTTTVVGTRGVIKVSTGAVFSSNDSLPNRIYYSKLNQPDAVPIVNIIDVGAKDKAILRIFPLRDSLFIYKEDGLFRISGEVAPFTLSLFDASAILLAPDSLSLCNNVIYAWTTQGIVTTSESGVTTISRPIDTDILKFASNNYPNFKTVTWGLGYESDNSYTVFTNKNISDTVATIGYRHSNLTNTWTTVDKSEMCGIINPQDDRMYLGATDVPFIEQERKTFTRLDYSDRELSSLINKATYFGNKISLPNVIGLSIGDGFVQNQLLTNYTFNTLLQKLDNDSGLGFTPIISIGLGQTPLVTTSLVHNLSIGQYVTLTATNSYPITDGIFQVLTVPTTTSFTFKPTVPVTTIGTSGTAKLNYTKTLAAVAGNDLRVEISSLASKLDGDPRTVNKNYFTLIQPISGTITANTIAPSTIVTSTAHGLINGRVIAIAGSNGNLPINGTYTITKLDNNTFSIPASVLITAGTTGSYTTQNNDFQDILACYNALIANLNVDTGLSFKNYLLSSGITEFETIIIDINTQSNTITLNDKLDYIVGPIIIFKAIKTQFTYSPNTMGDAMSLKHIREATVMFENRAFTNSTLSFASDLHPAFTAIAFNADGPGIFGGKKFGTSYFGGGSNSASFRTLVPGVCQRCRYLLLQFNHTIAREKVSVYGISLTGELTSSRAYK